MIQQAKVARSEKRGEHRFPTRLNVPCKVKRATEQARWVAAVRNISEEGIGLVVNRQLKPGMTLTIELPTANGVRKLYLVRVRHAKAVAGTRDWVVGGMFVRTLDHDTFMLLKDRSPVVVSHDERRKSVRHSTRLHASCLVTQVAEEGMWLAKIRNISAKGIGLLANRPFKVGDLLTLELPGLRPVLNKPRLARVKYAQAQPGEQVWVLGVAFLTKLNPAELSVLK